MGRPITCCTFDGCDRRNKAHGLCKIHYEQQRKGKTLTPIRSKKPDHGTRNRYNQGCRCELCTLSNREGAEKWRKENPERWKEYHNKSQKNVSNERRQRVDKIKTSIGCVDCGYNKDPAALDFDHIDEPTKKFLVSRMMNYSWEKIEAEMAKCVIRCANCHRIRSRDRQREKRLENLL